MIHTFYFRYSYCKVQKSTDYLCRSTLHMMYAQICIPSYLNTYNEHTLYEKFVCCEVSNKRMIKLLVESKHS